jgi:hypothetical protein
MKTGLINRLSLHLSIEGLRALKPMILGVRKKIFRRRCGVKR